MDSSMISTKLYIPQTRSPLVRRTRLTETLEKGVQNKLTLVSASAGYGKTTLVSNWLTYCDRPAAWLSLDEGDNDLARFFQYLFAALKKMSNRDEDTAGGMDIVHSSQLPPIEVLLSTFIHKMISITAEKDHFIVLDDYHVIQSEAIHHAVDLLIERMPIHMHVVIITRNDPPLSLARLRVRNQMTEIRVSDLRFTQPEAAEFLENAMGVHLSPEQTVLLESRTEGWIAGLQLAALSIKEQKNVSNFLSSFTGNHRFILDYLVEEVLKQQSVNIQHFLLRTSILDRLCGPLCEAILQSGEGERSEHDASGQEMLEYLERSNLFIVPLDHERRWYRYHHLFADLLRQRLLQYVDSTTRQVDQDIAIMHQRASEWYENHNFELEAFHHAVAADDIERAAHLLEGKGMPLLFRGALIPALKWLDSLPRKELDARPVLWVLYASSLIMSGRITEVESKLKAAEHAMHITVQDQTSNDLLGHIASIRATIALSKHEVETILLESNRALKYLHPDNLPIRTAASWSLGYAYQLQGDRTAASKAYMEALTNSKKLGHVIITIMASLGLGMIQEGENQLHMAAETYHWVLNQIGDMPMPAVCEAYLGLARICYEWNDLDTALHHVQLSIQLAKQLEQTDRAVAGELVLAQIKLAQGDVGGVAAILSRAEHIATQNHFILQILRIAEAQVHVMIQQEHLSAAGILSQKYDLPLSRARIYLAQGDTAAALAILESAIQKVEAKDLKDERLKIFILMAIALYAHGEKTKALEALREALTMAEPSGFIRLFLDEGKSMKILLGEAVVHRIMPDYTVKLLAHFDNEEQIHKSASNIQLQSIPDRGLIEPLSVRELEVLHLIAQGLSNHEISERLFIALTTVKGHNRVIFDKLQVKRRTEAVARARQLGLI
ncbi:LuxR C-terminal-related transcriptional regulator [Paenibacillus sp. SC116]|uniref:LuxR C-terminal-related transcriptional regulator n=1 Tax=Paenibacillus sp. SC116 TaxID=2968986 RepID=UPI00215A66D2|nr:LuxR C-terminal-related transcriptional regulator [Paenibacillus sp. SC116]MCR8842065.1 LuxR C-terminal-related transcriptional regulator [Paenibacillus sp. SC116]